jgi:hypothetical protein
MLDQVSFHHTYMPYHANYPGKHVKNKDLLLAIQSLQTDSRVGIGECPKTFNK